MSLPFASPQSPALGRIPVPLTCNLTYPQKPQGLRFSRKNLHCKLLPRSLLRVGAGVKSMKRGCAPCPPNRRNRVVPGARLCYAFYNLRCVNCGAQTQEALAKPLSRAGGGDTAPPWTAENSLLSHWRDGVLAVRRGFASQNTSRFYILAKPFCCPAQGEPLTILGGRKNIFGNI
jgi:hypothetical protein